MGVTGSSREVESGSQSRGVVSFFFDNGEVIGPIWPVTRIEAELDVPSRQIEWSNQRNEAASHSDGSGRTRLSFYSLDHEYRPERGPRAIGPCFCLGQNEYQV